VKTTILSSKHAENIFLSLGGPHQSEVCRLEMRESKQKRRSKIVMHINIVDFHGIDFFLREYISVRLSCHVCKSDHVNPFLLMPLDCAGSSSCNEELADDLGSKATLCVEELTSKNPVRTMSLPNSSATPSASSC
jgi:hypothetical protein